METHDVAEILELCIVDLTEGSRGLDQCLDAHPNERREVEPLLRLVQQLAPRATAPDPNRKARARDAFVAALRHAMEAESPAEPPQALGGEPPLQAAHTTLARPPLSDRDRAWRHRLVIP